VILNYEKSFFDYALCQEQKFGYILYTGWADFDVTDTGWLLNGFKSNLLHHQGCKSNGL